jgi:hypothetical protein
LDDWIGLDFLIVFNSRTVYTIHEKECVCEREREREREKERERLYQYHDASSNIIILTIN